MRGCSDDQVLDVDSLEADFGCEVELCRTPLYHLAMPGKPLENG